MGAEAMWVAALALLLEDARAYAAGRKAYHHACHAELAAAYRDVVGCGEMLRFLCGFSGHDAAWISWRFKRSLEGGAQAG